MSAWYRSTAQEFVISDHESILGILSSAAADHNFATTPESISAWRETISGLQKAAQEWINEIPSASEWSVLLEYVVPRRRRRIDALVIAHDIINLIEFKIGSSSFGRDARWQTEQYALDIRDFHAESRNRKIIPFLVSTNAKPVTASQQYLNHQQINSVTCVNFEGLSSRLLDAFFALSSENTEPIDQTAWDNSAYRPTPWIVEAAQTIYRNNDVREIRQSDSSNLDETVESVLELIKECRQRQKHGIAFITGAPGSGKTLAGLQVIHDHRISNDSGEATGVFLSGNRPLVEVIRKALVNDLSARDAKRETSGERARRTETFIQHAYQFRDEYAKKPNQEPLEKVILFDEAQRAWDAKQVARFTRNALQRSEPELFLEIMSRVKGWSVIIAVVGSGQEIN